jgi:hypothetical protein
MFDLHEAVERTSVLKDTSAYCGHAVTYHWGEKEIRYHVQNRKCQKVGTKKQRC